MKFDQRVTVKSSLFFSLFGFLLVTVFGAASSAQSPEPSAMPGRGASASELSDAFASAAKRVEPAVVSIDAKARPTDETARRTPSTDPDDILEFFRRQMPRSRPVSAVGSGFIVDRAGYIVTNAHVVDGAARINVRLDSGDEYQAELVGMDVETDIAVLKIDAGRELPTVAFGDSDSVKVGEWVLAIGSPFGLNRTVTAGIISQVQRETPRGSPFQRFIQTDAAINRGNSGGPLVNLRGEVIGVNSQIATSTGDYNGIGFALPAAETARVYQHLRENGRVRRGYLGVLLDSVRPEYAKVYEMGDERGAIITDVRVGDGPAATAGLKEGDIIVRFDGQPVTDAQDLIQKVAGASPDRSVAVVYLREVGSALQRGTVSLRLGERPLRDETAKADPPRRLPLKSDSSDKPFGLTISDVTPELVRTLNLEARKGVVVKVIDPESFIADVKASAGDDALGEGDIIQRFNRVDVTDAKAFAAMANKLKKGDPVVLHVLTPISGSTATIRKIVQFTVQ
ncbi:MAG TPA: trypsin-like peptidase domain-containing protein [Pyrinomonadaceae bacterium]|nr:trypsin-like peptidase domain-containing protein [Pyrinomonadaceae bacterium]